MKVSLLFPPTWHPSQPYLSLPSLTGFLAQAGVTNVTQRDLGIELLDEVVTKSYGAGLYQELLDKKHTLERERTGETGPGSAEHLARVTESLDRFPYLIDRIELAKDTLRSEGFYDMLRSTSTSAGSILPSPGQTASGASTFKRARCTISPASVKPATAATRDPAVKRVSICRSTSPSIPRTISTSATPAATASVKSTATPA